jgi:S-adenosylmethionine:diacylglycerol 3-amino-3-carboxypropyl transferase
MNMNHLCALVRRIQRTEGFARLSGVDFSTERIFGANVHALATQSEYEPQRATVEAVEAYASPELMRIDTRRDGL